MAALPRLAPAAYHRWQLPSGREWITFHRVGGAYVLRFPGLAHFRVCSEGRQVHCDALRNVPEATVRHLLHQVLPLLDNGQGATVLHGGAVEVNQRAVAFVGPTGRGKSTLAAALAAEGYRFLTDDALQVRVSASGELVAAPGEPHLRLWSDSERVLAGAAAPANDAAAKSRIAAGGRFPHCAGERPWAVIYLLDANASAETRFEPVRPAAALLELVQNSFLLDPESPALLKVQHENLSAVVSRVPVCRLTYARNYQGLPQVCQDVLAHVRSLSCS